jgi:hypothetical protein
MLVCRYVLKIQLPPTYPFDPPDFLIMTPNGRFMTKKKLCISFSSFHPETWSPSYNLTTLLVSFISFFAEEKSNAIGAMHTNREVKKRFAEESVAWNQLHVYKNTKYSDMLKIFQFLKPGLQTEASIKAAMALRYPAQQEPAKTAPSARSGGDPGVEIIECPVRSSAARGPSSAPNSYSLLAERQPVAPPPSSALTSDSLPAVWQPLAPAEQVAGGCGQAYTVGAQGKNRRHSEAGADSGVFVLDGDSDDSDAVPVCKRRRVSAPASNVVDLT